MAAIFVAVMLTYFLAAWEKVRLGGWDWATGSTLTRAVLRRGTTFSSGIVDVPGLLPTSSCREVHRVDLRRPGGRRVGTPFRSGR